MTYNTYPTPPTSTPRYSSETLSSQRTHSSTTSASSVPVPSAYTRTTGAYSSRSSEQPHSPTSYQHSQHHHQHQHQYHRQHGYQEEHDRQKVDHEETMRESEIERRLRKRDYAVEISRIMGRQLVTAMSKGKGGKGRTVSDG